MDYAVLLLAMILVSSAKFTHERIDKDYLSISNCAPIKGLFTILVFLDHYIKYTNLDINSPHCEAFVRIWWHNSQCVVVMFLFYSGYGMMEAIKRKRFPYVRSIMTQRFWKVLIPFDLIVLLFLAIQTFFGYRYSISKVLLSFTGWANIGNSNWYIFVTLCLYLLMFVAFYGIKWSDKMLYPGVVLFTVLSLLSVIIFKRMGRPDYSYNTISAFVCGVWYSLLHKQIEDIIRKSDIIYLLCILVAFVAYMHGYFNRKASLTWYTLWVVAFAALVILATMKVSFRSDVLTWFGNHVFGVYMMQRVPEVILTNLPSDLPHHHPYYGMIICFFATILLAIVVDYVQKNWINRLWQRKTT